MVGNPCKVEGCPFPAFDTATGVCREHYLDPGFDPATIPAAPADPFADFNRLGAKAVEDAYPDALAAATSDTVAPPSPAVVDSGDDTPTQTVPRSKTPKE